MRLHYVTSNIKKFEEASLILQPLPFIQLFHSHLELDEIQGSPREIAFHKISQAFSLLREPCLIDDVSFHIEAFKGFPGPYIKSFLMALGEQGVWEVMEHFENRAATAVCTICIQDHKDSIPHIFEGSLQGTIVPPQGETRHGKFSWNVFFQPEGATTTIGEMPLLEISRISPRSKALALLKSHLESHASESLH